MDILERIYWNRAIEKGGKEADGRNPHPNNQEFRLDGDLRDGQIIKLEDKRVVQLFYWRCSLEIVQENFLAHSRPVSAAAGEETQMANLGIQGHDR
ncbi:MAG: hypothetical protein LBF22_02300 [Deltaproteobacteria bacterium]|jgi:hypothetical protein|nr:hypothetical protein [Deltaproteobacteria bacterium]